MSAFYNSDIVSCIDPKLQIYVDGTLHDKADQSGLIIKAIYMVILMIILPVMSAQGFPLIIYWVFLKFV